MGEDENPRPPIKMRIGLGEKITKPRDKKFDCHSRRLREYTQLLHMIGAKYPQSLHNPDAELEPRSALDELVNAISCLSVLKANSWTRRTKAYYLGFIVLGYGNG